jgi:transcriptional regulator with XRE-family HTH domain
MTAQKEAAFVRGLGKCIRLLRVDQGLGLEQLADAARVPSVFLRAVERGLHDPYIINLRRVAEALRVPLAVLVDEAGDPSPVPVGSAGPGPQRSGDGS